MTIGSYTYTIRRYTPKRRGQPAGHGWVRDSPRAEVGQEVKLLVDEIAKLRRAPDIDSITAVLTLHHPDLGGRCCLICGGNGSLTDDEPMGDIGWYDRHLAEAVVAALNGDDR